MQQFKFTATLIKGKHSRTLDGQLASESPIDMDIALHAVAEIARKGMYADCDSLRLHIRLLNKPAPATLPN